MISITIGSLTIGPLASKQPVIGVADLVIRWGRDSIHDDVAPDTATFSIIDPDGDWGTDATLIGRPVIITRTYPSTRIVFRGTITDAKTTRIGYNGGHGWRVTLTAASNLAQVAALTPTTNSADSVIASWWATQLNAASAYTFAAGGYAANLDTARLNDLNVAFRAAITGGIDPAPGITFGGRWLYLRGLTAQDIPTLLDHVAQIYKSYGYGYPLYNPASDAVTLGSYSPAPDIALISAASGLTIKATAGATIPASALGVPDGPELTSTLRNAITHIELKYRTPPVNNIADKFSSAYVISGAGAIGENNAVLTTALPTPNAGGRTVLSIDSMYTTFDDQVYGTWTGYMTAQAQLDSITQVVQPTIGWMQLPELLFRAWESTGDAAVDDLLLSPLPTQVPVTIKHSIFAGLPAVAPTYYLIGGALRYGRHGWSNQITTCPTSSGTSQLTFQQLCTNQTPTLADFNPAVTLGDLTTVTIGLS